MHSPTVWIRGSARGWESSSSGLRTDFECQGPEEKALELLKDRGVYRAEERAEGVSREGTLCALPEEFSLLADVALFLSRSWGWVSSRVLSLYRLMCR